MTDESHFGSLHQGPSFAVHPPTIPNHFDRNVEDQFDFDNDSFADYDPYQWEDHEFLREHAGNDFLSSFDNEESEIDRKIDDTVDHLSDSISDVASHILNGDSESALRRLGEYGKGLDKLQSQRAEAMQNISNLRSLFEGIGSGNRQAISVLEDVLTSHGTSLSQLAMGNPTGPQPGSTDNGDQQWAAQHGRNLSQEIGEATGLWFDPLVLAQARQGFPPHASMEDIEEAVMRADPRAYRSALANRSGQNHAPNSALVSRGGKGAANANPGAILNDPRKFEAYLKG